MKRWRKNSIYKISNTINEKVYIGQTTVSVQSRWEGHLKSRRKKATPGSLYYDMIQLGEENFYVEEIEVVETIKKLNEREKFWITHYDSFKNGYNRTSGGGFQHEREASAVAAYTKEGDFVESFDTLQDAVLFICKQREGVKQVDSVRRSINRAIEGIKPTMYSFQWLRAEIDAEGNFLPFPEKIGQFINKQSTTPSPVATPVAQYSLDGNFIQSFPTLTSASSFCSQHLGAANLEAAQQQIIRIANNPSKSAYNHLWLKNPTNNFTFPPTTTPYQSTVGDNWKIQIHQIDSKTKKILNTFPSMVDAGKYLVENKLTRSTNPKSIMTHLSKIVQTSSPTAYGFLWEKVEK